MTVVTDEYAVFTTSEEALDILEQDKHIDLGNVTNDKDSLQWPVIFVIFLALLTDWIMYTILIPIVPSIFPNVNQTLIGLLFASKAMAQVVCNQFMGMLVDKVGPQPVLFVSLLFLFVSIIINCFFIGEYAQMVAARVGQGIASSAVWSAGLAFIALEHNESNRGKAMGFATSGGALGVLSGPLIGAVLYRDDSWWWKAAPFIFVAGLVLIAAFSQVLLFCYRKHKGIKSKADSDRSNITTLERFKIMGKLLRDPYVLIMVTSSVVAMASISMAEPTLPRYLSTDYNLDKNEISYVWSAGTLGYLIFTPVCGIMCDKIGRRKWLLVMLGLGIIAASLPCVTLIPSVISIVCFLACIGAGVAFVDAASVPMLADILEYRGMDAFGSIFSIMDSFLCVAVSIGPLGGSALMNAFGLETALIVFAIIAVLFIPVVYCGMNTMKMKEVQEKTDDVTPGGDDDTLLKKQLLT